VSVEAADVLASPAGWYRTRIDPFHRAAWIDGRCWVLRLNDFPEHPLHTLFVDGEVVGDVDDLSSTWVPDPLHPLPVLDRERRDEVIELMARLGPYGAEQGRPCDGDWCTCSILTEDRVRTYVPEIEH
jgi:hypothetical protein